MPLTLVAGHRPATTALRTTCHRRQLLDANLPPAIRPCPSNAGRSYLPNSAFVTIDRLRRTQHLDPPRSNPHSANLRHGLASPPAVSSLGGFRTPALGVRGTVSHWAGIRKPSHEPTFHRLSGVRSSHAFAARKDGIGFFEQPPQGSREAKI